MSTHSSNIHTQSTYKYVILLVCSLMLGLAYMSLSSWAVSLVELQTTFNLSSASIMAGGSMLIAGYAVGSFVQGKLLAIWGWRRVFNTVMLAFVISTCLIPMMSSYPLILILRFIQGWGLIVTITNTLVCGWFPTSQRGLASGTLLGFVAGGVAAGSLLTGLTTPIYGWQFNFYLLAGLTLIGMIIFNILIKSPPDYIEGELTIQNNIEEKQNNPLDTKNIYTHPVMLMLGFGMFFVFFNVYGMYSFMSDYFYSIGFSTAQVGTIGFWNGLIGLISTPFGGWIGDFFIKKGIHPIKARAYTMAVVAFGVGTIGCMLMPLIAPINFTMAIFAALLAGWGCPAANGPICSLPSDIFGAKKGGEAVGFILFIAGTGGVISPILVSYIASVAGWMVGWYITAASAAAGILICLMIPTIAIKKNI